MEVHDFKINFFINPVICEFCSDYIWGNGFIGYTCEKCFRSVHSLCKQFLLSSSKNCNTSIVSHKKNFSQENYKIESVWLVNEVKEWLAVVNLHRYSELFSKSNINGEKLLKIDKKSLIDMRIHDQYHHDAILTSINELKFRSLITYDLMKQNELVFFQDRLQKKLTYSAKDHYFLVATLSSIQQCNVCARPLLGIIHQGLLCQLCGLLVHRQCSYLGLCACNQKIQRAKLVQYFVFGVSLFELMNEYVDAPALLQKSFQDIEKRGIDNNEDLYDVYRLSTDTRKIDKFKQQLNEHGVDLVQFCYHDLNTIAAIVKSFLRELQDSVIPEEEYKTICRLATKNNNRSEFVVYINSLHPVHLKCLKFIMKHLIRIWKYQHDYKNCNYLPDKLIHIFRTILMRPAWSNIIDVVYNLDVQSLVMKRLLLEYDWDIELPKYKERPDVPPLPQLQSTIGNLIRNISPYGQVFDVLMHKKNDNDVNINDQSWYWADVTRDDTLMLLKDCKDGAYLVRDSSEKQILINKYTDLISLYPNPNIPQSPECSTPAAYTSIEPQKSIPESATVVAPYTLCMLKGSSVKSIKIFYDLKTKRYDIEVPCRFVNVKELIEYYTENSLKEYNINLDLKLTDGLSKFKFGKTTEWNLDRLYSSFRDAYQQYENSIRKCEGIEIEIETLYLDLKNKHLANHAFENIIKIYEQQIDILKENLLKYQENSNKIKEELFINNIQQLTERIDDLNKKRQELVVDCDYLNTIIQQLQDELEQLRPDLIELRKKRENYHMWLIQRGEDDEKIMKTLKSPTLPTQQQTKQFFDNSPPQPQPQPSQISLSPHENSINWYSANSTRDDAERILKNQQNGTYLVRTSKQMFQQKSPPSRSSSINSISSNSNSSSNSSVHSTYVLSLIHNNTTIHCLIDEDDEGCFIRLNSENKANIRKFSSLTNLVVYYSKNSLKNYNQNLDTCLLYPVFYNKPPFE